MVRKLAGWGVLAVLLFYVVSTPHSAAGAVHQAGAGLGHVLHQVSVFLHSL